MAPTEPSGLVTVVPLATVMVDSSGVPARMVWVCPGSTDRGGMDGRPGMLATVMVAIAAVGLAAELLPTARSYVAVADAQLFHLDQWIARRGGFKRS